MDPEITISLEMTEPTLQFRLQASDGGAPRVTSVTVLDLASQQPVWWLLPEVFSETLPFTIAEPSEQEIDQLASIEEIDALEDLPPTDPRHQSALRERVVLADGTQVPLSSIAYGVVPPGFRQALPQDAPAPLLRRGGSFAIHAMGAGVAGYLAFQTQP